MLGARGTEQPDLQHVQIVQPAVEAHQSASPLVVVSARVSVVGARIRAWAQFGQTNVAGAPGYILGLDKQLARLFDWPPAFASRVKTATPG